MFLVSKKDAWILVPQGAFSAPVAPIRVATEAGVLPLPALTTTATASRELTAPTANTAPP